MRRFLGTALFIGLAGMVRAQAPDAERIQNLEDRIQKQQTEIDALKQQKAAGAAVGESAPPGDPGEFRASFTDGLHFKTHDGQFDFHFGGRWEEQYRYVFDLPHAFASNPGCPAAQVRAQPNSFYVKEAFLSADGTLFKEFGFKVNGDFGSAIGGPAGVTRVEAAYVEWKRYSEFTLQFGQFKSPASQETLTSPLFNNEIERSVVSLFVPNFELGAMAYGSIESGLFGYQLGVTNGRSNLPNQGRATNDDNNDKEFFLRLTTSPWATNKGSLLERLRLGVYGSTNQTSKVNMNTAFALTSTELAVTWLIPTGYFDGTRTRLGGELSWAWGPFSLRSEYLLRNDEVANAGMTVHKHLGIQAGNASVSWLLTGEDKTVETRVTPAHPFDIGAGQWGALELVARVGHAALDADALQAVGTTLAGQTNRMTHYTVGINWWPVKNVRFSIDGVHEDYHDGITFYNGDHKRSFDGFLTRMQVDF